jgi:hypothetical protein
MAMRYASEMFLSSWPVCADVFDIGHGVDAVCVLNNAYLEREGQGAMVLACVNTARQCVASGPNPASRWAALVIGLRDFIGCFWERDCGCLFRSKQS